jgi:hypothetical protein
LGRGLRAAGSCPSPNPFPNPLSIKSSWKWGADYLPEDSNAEEVSMKRCIMVFWAIVLSCGFVVTAWAAESDTVAILKTIEGNWNSEILGKDGKNYIRPWVFKVEGIDLIATITRPGLKSEESRVPLDEISKEGETLKFSMYFPPYRHKADIVVTKGKIKGTAWRQGHSPAPSDISFSRR